ncbi:glycoside hydrolase family 3 protein [Metabacillus rhizolycopersici]|uniref:beta-glucosidase n=1 Tax=Metabacillus rhizolycopersici TaxID=2875709 RepID=A0ABS7URB8_9BACI|nr:glycoside hydrolase family 3 N-terminal domain-containing protein [Metabacillus rhizolycopersici]MBZ5750686.1 glycoside hydrolase family 3 C-terminal domain-containing protein [Metabacillus rhizolycopersici]
MASVVKKIRKGKKLRKVMTATLALSLLAPVMVPQASAANSNEDLGYVEPGTNTNPGDSGANTNTYRVLANKKTGQPEIEAANKGVLKVKGLQFRDLDGDKSLDTYEDWRNPVKKRVADLVSKMTLAEKAGLMLINTHTPIANPTDGRYVLDNDPLIVQKNMRYVIFRQTPTVDVIAKYTNQLQELGEASRLGIPVVVTSNPRNHASTDYTNISASEGQHSFWPGPLGFAAAGDEEAVGEFSEIAAQEWRAAGIRKVYGYTADIATDPLWARIEDTFGEDPKVASDMIYNVIKGFQGDKLGTDSVAITVKHFPGGGARDNGLDPHFVEGKFNPYPTEGSMLKYHIPPFKAAIKADVSSIMPYYAYPSNDSADQGLPWFSKDQQFEEVGFALNKAILDGFLRGKLGFKGYVNSDTGAVGNNAWGAEFLTPVEKVAKAINAGTDIISGSSDPSLIVKAVEQGLLKESVVNESVSLLLTEMMNLGLFEDPYVDPQHALDVVANPKAQELAYEAHLKSIVLLRNDNNLLPLNDAKLKNVKLYVEMFPGGTDGASTKGLIETIKKHDPTITITNKLEEATHAYIYVKPVQSNWDNNPRITVGPETGITNVDRIISIQKAVPTITAVNMTNPWVLDQIEPNAAAFISTFGTKAEAIVDVIRGDFNPTGKLPFALPASMAAVDNEVGDVPSFAPEEDASYAYLAKSGDAYAYNFGLSYDSKDGQTTISELKQLINEKLSKHGYQKSLLNQIEKAEKYLASGKTARAISTLNDTKKKVDKLPKKHVTNEVKQEINQAIDEVIANLKK